MFKSQHFYSKYKNNKSYMVTFVKSTIIFDIIASLDIQNKDIKPNFEKLQMFLGY